MTERTELVIRSRMASWVGISEIGQVSWDSYHLEPLTGNDSKWYEASPLKAGTHYPFERPLETGSVYRTPVETGRRDGPFERVVCTGL